MKNSKYTVLFFASIVALSAWSQESHPARVSGSVRAGLSTEYNTDVDSIELVYSTNDPRLGTNSGSHYASNVDDVSRNLKALYGAKLDVALHPKHSLSLSLDGSHDYERALGTRNEWLKDKAGNLLSRVGGQYDHSNELANELSAALDYTCQLPRQGSSLTLGYCYRWENESAGLEQHINEAFGWSMYEDNVLEQKINYHTHHVHIDYTLPVAKGHLLDFGVAYDRRELSVRTEQDWDEVRILDTDYRHLMQYGGIHARYRLRLGPVEAMARLEYRATHMQNQWLHDVLPTATIRYQIDSLHSLSAFYTIMLIRPEAQHLDTTHISDAFTQRFGSDRLVGVHVHNVALTYRLTLPKAVCAAEVRYLTASDGFNAIWMERGGRRIYTWGNEGVRHAIGLTPSVETHLSSTTDLQAAATVMWDKRVAEAINLENANWGIRANMRIRQQLLAGQGTRNPYALNLVVRGDYAFHNTLDVYSYAGHGGSAGADLQMRLGSFHMSLAYTCLFKPNIHILQGAYVGDLIYSPGVTHLVALNLSYNF